MSSDQSQKERLTVIIPCYNEAKNIEETVSTVRGEIPNLDIETDMLLINDGSTDNTRDKIRALSQGSGDISTILNSENLGLGSSILKAYELLPSDRWATVFPGDNELIFSSIKNFLRVRDEYDLILGYLKNPVIRPFMRRIASDVFTEIGNFLYGFNFRYFNGMKLYKIGVFKNIDVKARGHAFNPELIAKAVLRNPELSIGEAAFLTKGRKHGSSKAFRLKSVLQAVNDLAVGYKSVRDYRQRIIETQ